MFPKCRDTPSVHAQTLPDCIATLYDAVEDRNFRIAAMDETITNVHLNILVAWI
jgi:hypothetical protein